MSALLRALLRRWLECLLLILLSLAYAEPVRAHSGSAAFIELTADTHGGEGEWLLALRDLDAAVGIDLNRNGELTWGELRTQMPALDRFARAQIRTDVDGEACTVALRGGVPVQLDELVYLRWPLRIDCGGRAPTALRYDALFDRDSSHRVLLKWQVGDMSSLHVLSPQQRAARLNANRGALALVRQGFAHILEGADHLLFLLALLIPVLCATQHVRLRQLLTLISAFTLGHSLTLALTTLGSWVPSLRLVECAIAATVIVAGINIAVPLFREHSWRVALLFGLIHGCGLATALRDLHLPRAQFALALLQFNVGVEIGQLLVVALTVPLLVGLQRWFDQRRLRSLSAVATVGAGFLWLIQRLG